MNNEVLEEQDTLDIALELAQIINGNCANADDVATILKDLVAILRIKFADLRLPF